MIFFTYSIRRVRSYFSICYSSWSIYPSPQHPDVIFAIILHTSDSLTFLFFLQKYRFFSHFYYTSRELFLLCLLQNSKNSHSPSKPLMDMLVQELSIHRMEISIPRYSCLLGLARRSSDSQLTKYAISVQRSCLSITITVISVLELR